MPLLHGKCLPWPSPARLAGVLLLAKPLAFPLSEGRYQLILARAAFGKAMLHLTCLSCISTLFFIELLFLRVGEVWGVWGGSLPAPGSFLGSVVLFSSAVAHCSLTRLWLGCELGQF